MNYDRYIELPDAAQYNVLWKEGIFIKQVAFSNRLCCLYGVGDFFIEVYRDAVTFKVLGKTGFRNGPLLDKYLKNNLRGIWPLIKA